MAGKKKILNVRGKPIADSQEQLVATAFTLQDARLVYLRHPGSNANEAEDRFSALVPDMHHGMVDAEGNLGCYDSTDHLLVVFSRYAWLQGGQVGK